MVFAGRTPPENLKELVPRIAPTPVFFIYAERGEGGESLSADYYEAAGEPKQLWKTDSGHTGGYDAAPEEYERRVVQVLRRRAALVLAELQHRVARRMSGRHSGIGGRSACLMLEQAAHTDRLAGATASGHQPPLHGLRPPDQGFHFGQLPFRELAYLLVRGRPVVLGRE